MGKIFSADLFYAVVTSMIEVMAKYGIIGLEMEAAGVYGAAAGYGAKALAIGTVTDNLITGASLSSEERRLSLNEMIEPALKTAIN